ncbi:hypothetical protein H4F38_20605 [Pectobacterium brasiliense]|uniref:hypothetical protein n=1 Tax=Pectobacterium brasiliense TaxID=180957 RepID=UPI000AFA520B|nr:hypothetical protein [Pectobacterium brasiliense]MBN3100147.1 hypothetical protein [Pectobacterium brasiliense]MBN3104350.1 hypothetical protein [Pectobacterium brasiliense]MBN3167434.1 hypothetical protein [Pectobacterium brasiliense]MBN3182715.1 hypothetical protein [Pectobacterium brasiliense]PPE57650.1 hypothetical protein F152LOC_03935 [Pectobacterium brasiliense]
MVTYKVIECKTAKDFLNEITPWNSKYNLSDFVFRGHSSDSYELLPNSFRDKTHKKLQEVARSYINEKHKFAPALKK